MPRLNIFAKFTVRSFRRLMSVAHRTCLLVSFCREEFVTFWSFYFSRCLSFLWRVLRAEYHSTLGWTVLFVKSEKMVVEICFVCRFRIWPLFWHVIRWLRPTAYECVFHALRCVASRYNFQDFASGYNFHFRRCFILDIEKIGLLIARFSPSVIVRYRICHEIPHCNIVFMVL